jgi:hypothetical protein
MIAISLWQPWATLIARGLKLYETRDWQIDHRGSLAIHASKKKFTPANCSAECRAQLLQDSVDPWRVPLGAVLCIVDLVDCQKVEAVRGRLSARELMYGKYGDGRYAWQLENIRVLPAPIELSGHQGIFHWKDGERVLAEVS